MSLLPNHDVYVMPAYCVCIYELYVLPISDWERGRMCKCSVFQNLKNCKCFKCFKILKINVTRCNCV